MAICFRCAAAKPRALDVCAGCGSGPRTNRDYLVSTALSTFLSSEDELARYREEVLAGDPPSVPHEVLLSAIEALKDPAALAVLRSRPLGATPSTASTPSTGARGTPSAPTPPIRQPAAGQPPAPRTQASAAPTRQPRPRRTGSALFESPFAILDATTHDNRRRIGELADENAPRLGDEPCRQLRTALTSPSSRLASEIAWLPGVPPEDVDRLLDLVHKAPLAVRQEQGLPTLAHLNLLAGAIQTIDGAEQADGLAALIQDIGNLADQLDLQGVLEQINADRAVSGFAPLTTTEQLEAELIQRRQDYLDLSRAALDKLPSITLVQVMGDIATGATAGGERPAPELIAELIDRYEAEAQVAFLPTESESIGSLVDGARTAASAAQHQLEAHIDALDITVRNWNQVARPIQLSASARATAHGASRQLANDIRKLGIELFDRHGLLAPALRIMDVLGRHFTAVPEIPARAARDKVALEGLARESEQRKGR
ncbi:MAG: hypothetical protein WCZ28_13095 [Burkholderiaceae bacterium]